MPKLSYRAKNIIRTSILLFLLGCILVFIYINVKEIKILDLRKLEDTSFSGSEKTQFIKNANNAGALQIQQKAIQYAIENNDRITLNEAEKIYNLHNK